jgi:hypothetical protein
MHTADWYDDPNDTQLLRWWNGREWTQYTELRTDWPGARPPVPVDEIHFADIQPPRRESVEAIHFNNPL